MRYEHYISLCQFVLWDEEPALLFNGVLGFYKKDLVEDERETDYMIITKALYRLPKFQDS
jgi:hypothetical protein